MLLQGPLPPEARDGFLPTGPEARGPLAASTQSLGLVWGVLLKFSPLLSISLTSPLSQAHGHCRESLDASRHLAGGVPSGPVLRVVTASLHPARPPLWCHVHYRTETQLAGICPTLQTEV